MAETSTIQFHRDARADYLSAWTDAGGPAREQPAAGEAAFYLLEHTWALYLATDDRSVIDELATLRPAELAKHACDWLIGITLVEDSRRLLQLDVLDPDQMMEIEMIVLRRHAIQNVISLARELADFSNAEQRRLAAEAVCTAAELDDVLLSRPDVVSVASRICEPVLSDIVVELNPKVYWWLYWARDLDRAFDTTPLPRSITAQMMPVATTSGGIAGEDEIPSVVAFNGASLPYPMTARLNSKDRPANGIARERVRDNQWWYGESRLRERVRGAAFIELSIGGRQCRLAHSCIGKDGRPTHSFKFMDSRDRDYWCELRGHDVEIELVTAGDTLVEADFADDPETPPELVGDATVGVNLGAMIKREGRTLFDAYIFVDWSACGKSRQGRDSIWFAEGAFDDDGALTIRKVENPATRKWAEKLILERLIEHGQRGARVLIGFDFPYGYPNGWSTALNVSGNDWIAIWDLLANRVHDGADNANNRFDLADALNAHGALGDSPYWGRPVGLAHALRNLPAGKPTSLQNGGVVEFRAIEQQLRREGKFPKSVWQLYGNGSVGSQAMVGIPVLHRLRHNEVLRDYSRVWPFETGWMFAMQDGPCVLHAEIWPGAIPTDLTLHNVKDAAQVISYVRWAAVHDVQGTLAARFNPFASGAIAVPPIRRIEGWILR